MEAKAVARYVRISPRKVRIVLDLIRGKSVTEALGILRFTPKRGSRLVEKVLRSALANAENNLDLDPENLYVVRAYADEGPRLKRYHPRRMGQAFPILKRTSHITVVVGEK
ncbi:MAG: large subunit ribosomal protein [Bacillota bacterium]|jgi:large subunit ribosomal protein L22|nr:large subunit ribosomal protein [Bacillota bacterium]MDK2856708.1 large subunit ribosomal protein [Bacillota bacterium]MDK2924532.1 large subunit ribosomal protein [Bacillota bacterium]